MTKNIGVSDYESHFLAILHCVAIQAVPANTAVKSRDNANDRLGTKFDSKFHVVTADGIEVVTKIAFFPSSEGEFV